MYKLKKKLIVLEINLRQGSFKNLHKLKQKIANK